MALGFSLEAGDCVIDGIDVHEDVGIGEETLVLEADEVIGQEKFELFQQGRRKPFEPLQTFLARMETRLLVVVVELLSCHAGTRLSLAVPGPADGSPLRAHLYIGYSLDLHFFDLRFFSFLVEDHSKVDAVLKFGVVLQRTTVELQLVAVFHLLLLDRKQKGDRYLVRHKDLGLVKRADWNHFV